LFFKLTLLLLVTVSSILGADLPSEEEITSFATSSTWLKLYVYRKQSFGSGYNSKASEDLFFFHQEGRTDPRKELTQALKAFQTNTQSFGQRKSKAACAFPARYSRIKERWPDLFPDKINCPELESWLSRLNTSKIHFVYVGSYPNNPASMFGHTLIRLKNESKSDLLDYTLGFRANVDPNDNPITYTANGLMGGYHGYYHIKPYYLNLGLYNNSESRGLWEYELDLSEKEVEFFLKHVWEVSFNTGFPYYFMDENCSFYLLTLLEATRPSLELTSKQRSLVYPIETLKDAFYNLSKEKSNLTYRASINEKFYKKVNDMSILEQQKVFDFIGGRNKVLPSDIRV